MSYPAKAIANYFISKSITDPKKSFLTPLKLIKLIYIAHGFYLALKGESLIQEPVEAWQYGPVVRSIYAEFKKYGNGSITQLAEIDKDQEIPQDDKYTLSFLDNIWSKYGDFDGIELSAWSHEEYSPWHDTWINKKGRFSKSTSIENDLIRDYFKTILKPIKN